MSRIKYQDHVLLVRKDENLLDALLRQGVNVPFSCKSGVCHVCMLQCREGEAPAASQQGLRPDLVDQGCFLACQCVPASDMEIGPPAGLFEMILVAEKSMMSPYVAKILLEPPSSFEYQAGQFINVRREDGVVRSYSLASLPGDDYFLELHVQRKQGGEMSNWLLDTLAAGDGLSISGPFGECTYPDGISDRNLLMVGTGTGMSPLYAVLRDALRKHHRGEIHIYQGGRDQDRFYLRDQFRQLEAAYPNVRYTECVSGDILLESGQVAGRAHTIAFARHLNVQDWHFYFAGLAEMVEAAETLALAREAGHERIHSDPFALKDLRMEPRKTKQSMDGLFVPEDDAKYPPPDMELWAALKHGETLTLILQDFYKQVFEDPRLSGFFEGVTRQRLIEKQFSFLQRIMTGEKIYFGDRPRNSHHWMIISDELFDYRANMMVACLRKHGLSEEMVRRFHQIEEFYRPDIVKSAAFPKKMGDMELPLDGFEELEIDVGSLCDSCNREISAGEKVRYHVRIGKVYCSDCNRRDDHHE